MSVFLRNLGRCFSSSTTSNNLINVTETDCVKTITLNNPKTRNALSLEMMIELNKAFGSVKDHEKCIVLASKGPVFSAGHNLKELDEESGTEHHKLVFSKCTQLMNTIHNLSIPLVGRVHALAAAAGCQLVGMCDVVVAAESATFSTPGINFGLFCSTPGIAVARAVPHKLALYMLLTGKPITSQEALNGGLVSKVVPDDKLDEELEAVVCNITAKSLPVLKLGKKFYNEQIQMGLMEAYKCGEDAMVNNLKLPDGKEGIAAFKQKRKPTWR